MGISDWSSDVCSSDLKDDNDYIIRGNRGTVSYLSIGTQKGGYETDGKMEPTGFIDVKDLQTDVDGNFELRISRNKPAHGNWLAMESADRKSTRLNSSH